MAKAKSAGKAAAKAAKKAKQEKVCVCLCAFFLLHSVLLANLM